ncbi:big1 [Tasmannia lanceolata]|uniref:big1 n=1 Tax=Tasmannia lanceolata TaxID=3420 RepID=UPI004063AE30
MELEMKGSKEKKQTPPPPPPPPLPRIWTTRPAKVCRSVTRDEIARFWRQKKMEEEDHLLAALKAAARIRARNLTEEDYSRFKESLNDNIDEKNNVKEEKREDDYNKKEIRVGIKDWWTKSKYAYLNQPAIQSMDKPKRTSNYTPYICYYKPSPPQAYSLGVF